MQILNQFPKNQLEKKRRKNEKNCIDLDLLRFQFFWHCGSKNGTGDLSIAHGKRQSSY